jgi:hypothetical protein
MSGREKYMATRQKKEKAKEGKGKRRKRQKKEKAKEGGIPRRGSSE